jgi:hypothetical protein
MIGNRIEKMIEFQIQMIEGEMALKMIGMRTFATRKN